MISETISHYKILEKLGEGGMGVVYKAQDTKLDRVVVLKFLSAQIRGDPEVKSRFVHEAKAAAALNHPHICTIYEIDEFEGQPFIAMEFIEGRELQEIVNTPLSPPSRGELKGGVVPLPDVLKYAIQIADGLQAAHEKGIIHRDIKPANIMVTSNGQVKIMDFGLAKVTGQTKLTQTGTTVGTIAYMSPEQLRGETVDASTDLWAFGAVLYELATGRMPFQEDYGAALMYSIVNETPPPPSELRNDLPSDLERIILKCLCKLPKDRYPSAQKLWRDLQNIGESLAEAKVHTKIAQPEARPKTKRESERRQTTVSCANISGYSDLDGVFQNIR